eukprot:XP_011667066.1 PREDICTED: uncharacterized protein LOC100891352 isoform X1 [Strongylocentrotus purpuratus]
MNGMKMKKCSGKTHSVVQLFLILWMTSLIHIAVGDVFPCSGSNMTVPVTKVCDGFYNCDNYEDESTCRYSATYLPDGESHLILLLPDSTKIRLYNATLLRTNATSGFRVRFYLVFLFNHDDEVLIGTGNDPSDIQSVITTITGDTYDNRDDIYVLDTNEMWVAVIGGRQNSRILIMGISVTAIDLLNFFPCSGSNMSVSVSVVCDGSYDCDNYKDESICNYSATYLPEGESHFISVPYIRFVRHRPTYSGYIRLYNATLLQTNATKGFRVGFQDLELGRDNDELLIGTGNDPSDSQSVITTFHGYSPYLPDDIYVDTNEMWFAVIGGRQDSHIRMGISVTAIDLLNLYPCPGSNMSVSVTLVCDGFYNCDNYKDESSCNYSATYLEEGESHFISFSRTTAVRLYNASILQTNASNGFRVVFQYDDGDHDFGVQIGTGYDPSDIQSVIKTIDRDIYHSPDDVYVDSDVMWLAVIGGTRYSKLEMNVTIISIDLSTLFACTSSNMSVSPTVICDGHYQCDHYEDESACNFSSTYLEEDESYFINKTSFPTSRLYNAILLQTNAMLGFRVVFRDWYNHHNDKVQIGIGNDPSDLQSVIANIYGYRDDGGAFYLDTNEMWFAVIGSKAYTRPRTTTIDVEFISINLSASWRLG